MGLAVLTIVVSVLAGTLLAFLPRQNAGWMGPMRTFGLAAALSVVALHMMPESVEAIGAWALPALLLGVWLPSLLGRLGSVVWRARSRTLSPEHVALEAGYAGLLLHKVGDGVALGVYAGELHPASGSSGFATALAAHIVPVVAIVVLTFDSVRGRGAALRRALGLGLAGLAGVFLTQFPALGEVPWAHGWLAAMAAGMLLHVVTHDLGVDLPRTARARVLDFCMAVLGLGVSALGGPIHGGAAHAGHGTHGGHPGHDDALPVLDALFASLSGRARLVAPLFVLALLITAALVARRGKAAERGRFLGRYLRTFDLFFSRSAAFVLLGVILAALLDVSSSAGNQRWAGLSGVDLGPGVEVAFWLSMLVWARGIYRLGFRGFLLPIESRPGGPGGRAAGATSHHGHAHGVGHAHQPADAPAGDPPPAESDGTGLDDPRSGLKIPGP